LVIGAIGGGMMFVPVSAVRGWGFAAGVTGALLAAGAFLAGPLIAGFMVAAPWLVYAIAGTVGAVVLAGGGLIVWRMVKVERSISDDAVAKLMSKGKWEAAAAVKFAQLGGGEHGKQQARAI